MTRTTWVRRNENESIVQMSLHTFIIEILHGQFSSFLYPLIPEYFDPSINRGWESRKSLKITMVHLVTWFDILHHVIHHVPTSNEYTSCYVINDWTPYITWCHTSHSNFTWSMIGWHVSRDVPCHMIDVVYHVMIRLYLYFFCSCVLFHLSFHQSDYLDISTDVDPMLA